MNKIKVYHFHNGSGGGVLTVIKNLLKYNAGTQIENHVIYIINKKLIPHFSLPQLSGATSEQVFYYSPRWNFYYTCNRLAKLLPDDKSVIAAHDWLELGMVSNLGLRNPVVHFVHGDYEYYYNLSTKHEQSTDQFICISPVIYNKLCKIILHRKTDIQYCRFPVPGIEALKKENEILKIFYCVKDITDERKQFKILPLINEKLKAGGLTVNWTIVGDGMYSEQLKTLMNQHSFISYSSSIPNDEVIKLLNGQHLFILPSLEEGFPVSAVEAMKAGVVPLITDWNGATVELIIQNETAYYFKPGDAEGYADTILLLNADRKLLDKLSANAVKKANELFDPFRNTKNIEEVIIKAYHSVKKQKFSCKVYGSRLDKKWIPNFVVSSIRRAI